VLRYHPDGEWTAAALSRQRGQVTPPPNTGALGGEHCAPEPELGGPRQGLGLSDAQLSSVVASVD